MYELRQPQTVDPSLQAGNILPQGQEQAGFDKLQEPAALADTLEAFQADRLLARALDGPSVYRDGMNFGVVEDELRLMQEDEGMQHVSTTLLVAGEHINVYKPFGFLVDSDYTTIEHVAELDSGSSVDADGSLIANETNLRTVSELAELTHATHTAYMNEVNVTLPERAVRGLFVTSYSRPKLDALVTRQHIQTLGKGELPLFLYDQKQGALLTWEPSAEEVTELLSTVRTERMREEYTKNLASRDPATIKNAVGAIAVSMS